jgi:hypothetical protein
LRSPIVAEGVLAQINRFAAARNREGEDEYNDDEKTAHLIPVKRSKKTTLTTSLSKEEHGSKAMRLPRVSRVTVRVSETHKGDAQKTLKPFTYSRLQDGTLIAFNKERILAAPGETREHLHKHLNHKICIAIDHVWPLSLRSID